MVVEEYYSCGLNAFLSRKVDGEEVVKTAKAVVYSGGTFFALGALLKIIIIYGGKVAATGNWHPFRYEPKYKTERIEKSGLNSFENVNNLEKSVESVKYHDLLK